MSDIEKACVLCGRSCAGLPRIKDGDGRYAHKACAENARAGAGQREQEPGVGPNDELADDLVGMGDLLSDLETPDPGAGGAGTPCESCGHALEQDAMVCMGCGYNRETGQKFSTKVTRAPKKSAADSGGTGSVSPALGRVVAPLICGCVAALIGAGIWAGVAYTAEIRFGILAWALGGLIGLGVNLGSRDTGGFFFGLMGATIALGAVTLGNFWTVTLLVNKYYETLEPGNVPYEMLMQELVFEVADEWLYEEREIRWPKEWKTWEQAEWPDDFPWDLRDATEDRWDQMSWDEQEARRVAIADVTRANSQLIENEGFIVIMSDPRNIVWLIFAMGTAYYVAGKG